MTLAAKFTKLKTSVGGNREKTKPEFTFGMPQEEAARITRPTPANNRILSELEFAVKLSGELENRFDKEINSALDFLLEEIESQGVLTNGAVQKAEDMLAPLEKPAKEYKLILAAHAHIDMNWMWGYHETVALTLATFRTILNIMNEYPDFCFSQSQASVYKIVEEHDPELMEQIKEKIAEGRWEVTASAWVETDKNMPSTESLLNHIRYTKEYLSKVWGVKNFDIDFSPDTFGHSANIPEINNFGDVKYYYHCRALDDDYVLYRFKAPSGKEVLAYKEPFWYNSGITPHIGAGLIDISKKCKGFKTGLIVYGVGDHGGGPTRRDIERAKEMMEWKIYPAIQFGTMRQFFKEAEAVKELLPVVNHELNYFAPGCYTTQSRIKRANRRTENALYDAQALSSYASAVAGFNYKHNQFEKAWQNVLFTHFHDIITGSCTPDSREYAMGLYQASMAVASTQTANAISKVASQIDTSSIQTDNDAYNTQSEGAGAGFGIDNFTGVPNPERGSGKTRIYHIFNSLSHEQKTVAELTLWDWTGDPRLMAVETPNGEEVDFQLIDNEFQHYWDHKYLRVLVNAQVPALGYTTVVVKEKEPEEYKFYFIDPKRTSSVFDDFILENDYLRACFSKSNGSLISLLDKKAGKELINPEKPAGFYYLETECATSSAWEIGRHFQSFLVERATNMHKGISGNLCNSIEASYVIKNSTLKVKYSLDKNSTAIIADVEVDWHETGSDIIPVLVYNIPLAYKTEKYLYDIPAGSIIRNGINNDVPALQYGCAVNENDSSVILMADSKYGYRGTDNALGVTLINSSTSPDLYPERGIHNIKLGIGVNNGNPKSCGLQATCFNHPVIPVSSNSHSGTLPMESSFLTFESNSSVAAKVETGTDNTFVFTVYETNGTDDNVVITFNNMPSEAQLIAMFGKAVNTEVKIDNNKITFPVSKNSIACVKVNF